MTLMFISAKKRTCLKNESAVPPAGGMQSRGHLTFLGPASYTHQAYNKNHIDK